MNIRGLFYGYFYACPLLLRRDLYCSTAQTHEKDRREETPDPDAEDRRRKETTKPTVQGVSEPPPAGKDIFFFRVNLVPISSNLGLKEQLNREGEAGGECVAKTPRGKKNAVLRYMLQPAKKWLYSSCSKELHFPCLLNLIAFLGKRLPFGCVARMGGGREWRAIAKGSEFPGWNLTHTEPQLGAQHCLG